MGILFQLPALFSNYEPTAGGNERSTVGDGNAGSGVDAGGTTLKGDGVGEGGTSIAGVAATGISGATVVVAGAGFVTEGLATAGAGSAGGVATSALCLEQAATRNNKVTVKILFIFVLLPEGT